MQPKALPRGYTTALVAPKTASPQKQISKVSDRGARNPCSFSIFIAYSNNSEANSRFPAAMAYCRGLDERWSESLIESERRFGSTGVFMPLKSLAINDSVSKRVYEKPQVAKFHRIVARILDKNIPIGMGKSVRKAKFVEWFPDASPEEWHYMAFRTPSNLCGCA
jgi:hypothetical protein